ncbi:MAG: signal peptidase I [Deltaproteobacteria bacterium]|nr:signal peptidase I [Deltaproteobacteria bacterium]
MKLLAVRAGALAIAAFLFFTFVLLPVKTEDGDYTVVNRLAYLRGESPRRGDVVAIELAAGHSAVFLKRIVGMPGERFEIRKGRTLINGALLDEPYVKSRLETWTIDELTLGDDEYYVIGDDRGQPLEHHRLGRARRDKVLGKALR